jgi:hypothetical protein
VCDGGSALGIDAGRLAKIAVRIESGCAVADLVQVVAASSSTDWSTALTEEGYQREPPCAVGTLSAVRCSAIAVRVAPAVRSVTMR